MSKCLVKPRRSFGWGARPSRRSPNPIAAALALTACAILTGCGPRGAILPTEAERQVEGRALELLVRAAQSNVDVVAANAMEALVHVAPESGSAAYRAGLDSPDAIVRYAACVSIGDCRDRASAAAVRRRLDDPDPRVRLGAAYALCRTGETRWGGPILSGALTDHSDERMRAEAAFLIGKLGDKNALKRLRAAQKREESAYAVAFIEAAMAALGDDKMIDRMIQYTLKSDSVTRLLALQLLIEIADPRGRRALLYRLNDETDHRETRLLAARALGRIGDRSGYDYALDSLSQSATDLNDQMRIRVNAALALGAIRERRAISSLQRAAESDGDERVQVAACYAILEIIRGHRPTR